MAFNVTTVDSACFTAVKGLDVGAVCRILGATEMGETNGSPYSGWDAINDAVISAWGDGVLVAEPSYGTRCAQPEALAALTPSGGTALTACWHDRGISPAWQEWHNLLALASEGRLLSALDPSGDLHVRIGWDERSLDPYLAGSRFDYETISVQSPAGQRRGRGAGGSITVPHWRNACITALERFAHAEFHDQLVRSTNPERNFVLSHILPIPDGDLTSFMGPRREDG
ncbi:hypothetical protein ACIBKY_33425 [Nonomuraea sp. NPDC050394]|uniref:hypothetical protein n=1 Tax=Nonomuraea sp. NPDC050394 TaxID=3364363 RepID=UPI0037A93875